MEQYRLVRKKGEGTFSEVLEAVHISTGRKVAIKCMKQKFDTLDEVNKLREIQTLKKISPHPNIVTLQEILYNSEGGQLALVFELMDMNLYELISGGKGYLSFYKVKYIIYKVLKAIYHMNRQGIFHRDIKPENILIKGDEVKLADFGCCKGLFADVPHTEYISTRWYRPPECLMTDGYYDSKIDIWGIGCVLYEIITLEPLFQGDDEIDQINKIHEVIGTPAKELLDYYQELATHMEFDFESTDGCGLEAKLPKVNSECLDLLERMLEYEPQARITAGEAMRHPFFNEVRELEMKKEEEKALKRINNNTQNNVTSRRIRNKRRKGKNPSFESKSIRLPTIKENALSKLYKSKKMIIHQRKQTFKHHKNNSNYYKQSPKKVKKSTSIKTLNYMLTGKKLF